MRDLTEVPLSDGCDTNPIEPNIGWSDRQRRFLDAYRQYAVIAPAARLAGVHRCTVHRWRATPAFAEAMHHASEDFFRVHRAKVLADGTARRVWREDRERARRSMVQSPTLETGWGSNVAVRDCQNCI